MSLLALPFPPIDPVVVEFGPIALRWYGLAYVAGIFFAWWYAKRLLANTALWGPAGPPFPPVTIDDMILWGALGMILGGRLGSVLIYNLQDYLKEPWLIFAIWNGGMSFHGGFLGTVAGVGLFAWRRRLPVWPLIDVSAASVPIGLLLGRLANFVNGELYGRPSDAPWAIVFPGVEGARHPSQLYEAALEGIALFLFLRLLTHRFGKLATPAFVSGAFAAFYGAARIVGEFFREPDIQIGYLAGGLTMGMLLSLPMVIAGIATMVWVSRRSPAGAGPA